MTHPVNGIGGSTGNRLIDGRRGEQTTVEIPADSDPTLALPTSTDRSRSQ
jgi:hypothetical protein